MHWELDMLWELDIAYGLTDAWLGFSGTQLGLGSYWCRVVCEPTFGI